jgi:CPA2 family monovalent cation:H+ antiporter-2
MAAYLPLVTVLATGGTWWQAGLAMLVGVSAVAAAFAASQRWGGQIGRLLTHPEPEQLLLRVLGVTLAVAGLAELVGVSAAVGAFLVGLALTGSLADRARTVLAPLRDLFAAAFFLAIGLAVDPATLAPALPVALALAVGTAVTKLLTGAFAAARDGVGWRGQLRAGGALVPRGEFSIVILGLAGASVPTLAPLVTAYVFVLAVAGPILARYLGGNADRGQRVREREAPA